MKKQTHDLFYRPLPADEETEKNVLACLLLLGKRGHRAFGTLDPKDFYLGKLGFHGWLFRKIRSGRQVKGGLLAYLLQNKHRLKAATMGVRSLPLEIVLLMHERGGRRRAFDVRKLDEYAARLASVRRARRAVWDAETAYQKVWARWDATERRWHGG